MAKQRDATGLRPLGMVVATLLFWAVTYVIAAKVLQRHPGSALVRAGMVGLGVAGFLSWLVAIGRLILVQDEFSQRIHFVAIGLTCAATATLLLACDLLQSAGFVGDVPLQGIWMAMGVIWWFAILIATRYYR